MKYFMGLDERTVGRCFLPLRYLAVCGLLVGCAKPTQGVPIAEPTVSTASPSSPGVEVTVHGALREIMHKGRTDRRVDLGPMIGQKGLYGLGALEGLGGEVTVWDGQLWLSTPDGDGGATAGQHTESTAGATLLVTSLVTDWQERPVTQAVPFSGLDAFIEREALAAGVDVTDAFPFRIEGAPSRVDWHVIDGSKIPANAHGHAAHIRTAVRGALASEAVKILGFYSPKHHRIFTHHDTNTHAHVISEVSTVTGHVDHLDLSAGARLFLPAP